MTSILSKMLLHEASLGRIDLIRGTAFLANVRISLSKSLASPREEVKDDVSMFPGSAVAGSVVELVAGFLLLVVFSILFEPRTASLNDFPGRITLLISAGEVFGPGSEVFLCCTLMLFSFRRFR